MLDRSQPSEPAAEDDWEDAGEEDIPNVVLYVVVSLLLLSFSLYLLVGGHNHFH